MSKLVSGPPRCGKLNDYGSHMKWSSWCPLWWVACD